MYEQKEKSKENKGITKRPAITSSHSPTKPTQLRTYTRAGRYVSGQSGYKAQSANNTGLPDKLKSGIENLSGYSMDDVKVHYNSDKPAQLQAHAYARGTEIHLGVGQEKHLPHEAWHVVQQKQGRVKPTKQLKGQVNVNDDIGLEYEADTMGSKALQCGTSAAKQPTSVSVQYGSKPLIQRYLIVDNTDYTKKYKEEVVGNPGGDHVLALNKLITQIALEMLSKLNDANEYEKKVIDDIRADDGGKLRRQLKKWIEDKPGDKADSKNVDFGRKYQARAYNTHKELAFALHGWVKAKAARHREKELAEDIHKSDAIDHHLNSILIKIKQWIDADGKAADIMKEIDNPQKTGKGPKKKRWNIYQNYFKNNPRPGHDLPNKYDDVLKNPENYSFEEKTGTLHDLMHYFMENDKIDLKDPHATVLDFDGKPKRVDYDRPESTIMHNGQKDGGGLIKPEFMPNGVANKDDRVRVSDEENHPSYKYARKNGIPMYGRHSFSAARMMAMTQKAGGTTEEISAIAWAIMAYWRKDYDHINIPYHTLHEIMDFAPDYGVAYNPDDREKGMKQFSPEGLINTLKASILKKPNERDIKKLIETDSEKNVAIWFLSQPNLWSNKDVEKVLRTTNLPAEEFKQIEAVNLLRFFIDRKENFDLLDKIGNDKTNHVLSGFSKLGQPLMHQAMAMILQWDETRAIPLMSKHKEKAEVNYVIELFIANDNYKSIFNFDEIYILHTGAPVNLKNDFSTAIVSFEYTRKLIEDKKYLVSALGQGYWYKGDLKIGIKKGTANGSHHHVNTVINEGNITKWEPSVQFRSAEWVKTITLSDVVDQINVYLSDEKKYDITIILSNILMLPNHKTTEVVNHKNKDSSNYKFEFECLDVV
ncbi:DUF4157 domain-containing protein [Pseudoalteromonas ostreae]|uniref:eCIS core domain-containing protein n=1 Tax=Pseudoalteromonas ostreae TaxID=2774154 RepID=UPI001B387475|nr:DUF4157 domain-containing protein [Pseudoalteromonas ostreae]